METFDFAGIAGTRKITGLTKIVNAAAIQGANLSPFRFSFKEMNADNKGLSILDRKVIMLDQDVYVMPISSGSGNECFIHIEGV